MMEERRIQWFCSDEHLEANLDTLPPQNWPLVPVEDKIWDEYKEACATDADCPRQEEPFNQTCHTVYWEATIDTKNFSNGHGCYNWEVPVCPGKEFASVNANYENTGFSYFWQSKCASGESSATSLLVAGTSLLTMLSIY